MRRKIDKLRTQGVQPAPDEPSPPVP